MAIKIRLDSTQEKKERFLQHWTITDHDGSAHEVITRSQWGDFGCSKGGERVFQIEQTPCRADQIVGSVISCGYGPTEEGEEAELGAVWLANIAASGVDLSQMSNPA